MNEPNVTEQSGGAARGSLHGVVEPTPSESLIKAQEYMLKRQQEMLDLLVKKHKDVMDLAVELSRQNQKLHTELKGHREGKLWTLLVRLLPTQEMLRK